MLSEEALIVLAALGACGLLVLGVMELLWPARSRHPFRQHAPAHNRAVGHPRHARVGPALHTDSTGVMRRRGTLRPAPIVAGSLFTVARPAEQLALAAGAPSTTTETPTAGIERPVEAMAAVPAPVAHVAKPAVPVAKVIAPTNNPVVPAAKPGASIAKPAAPTTKPAAPTAKPGRSTMKPAALIAKRGISAAAPAAPAAPAAKPAAERAAPCVTAPAEAMSAVDECFALYQERRYAEVVTLGMATLADAGRDATGVPAQETAALWSIVALARQARGDDIGARGALEAAIHAAPEADRATYRHQLAALALHVAQDLLAAGAVRATAESDERLNALRAAVAWIDAGLAATPDDPALRDLRPPAFAALWPAYEQVVMGLVQRHEFRVARRLLREAIDHGEFPAARTEAFRELLSGTFSGEIGQLTAQAIRSMQEARESEALSALQRADELLGRLADEALPPSRREEVDRRLWWGYNKLGARRVDAGEFEEALEPLFHALRFASVGPDRQAETRAVLVRALLGAADTHALAIQQQADAGDREAAVVQTDKLWVLLRSATAQGVAESQLSTALARVQRLSEGLGRKGDA